MITVNSPAKINLLLKITGKRPDGYHEIDTIMQELELADTISIVPNQKSSISYSSEGLIINCPIEDNLVMKAANLFFEKFKNKPENYGVNIHLNKVIPPGSGMGGGSSNAVATLKGLNQLYDFPFTIEQLSQMAAQLGSDTVFFLYGGRCHCSGRGEIVSQLGNKETTQITLYIPSISISTAQVFKNFVYVPPVKDAKFLFNDLEPASFKVAPELEGIKGTLKEITGNDWQMTGSGCTYFYVLPHMSDFEINYANLKDKLPGKMIHTSFQYKGCYVSNN